VTEAERRKALTALAFINDKKAAEAMLSLTKSSLPDVATMALWWVDFRQTNDWADLLPWEQLSPSTTTSQYRLMTDLKRVVQDKSLTDQVRQRAALQMAKDPIGGNMLIELKLQGRLSGPISTTVSEAIFQNPDQNVRILASQFFSRGGKTLKVDFIARMQADASHGKVLFGTHCASCHTHQNTGADIGPDLSMIHKKLDKLSLLDAIIHPSASMVFGYEAYSFTTKDGNSLFGFLLSDGATIVVKDLAGKRHTIKAAQVVKREPLPNSLMPDPVSMGLDEQQLADISAFLLSF
jgi:putative heme-binding domain-containing protein